MRFATLILTAMTGLAACATGQTQAVEPAGEPVAEAGSGAPVTGPDYGLEAISPEPGAVQVGLAG